MPADGTSVQDFAQPLLWKYMGYACVFNTIVAIKVPIRRFTGPMLKMHNPISTLTDRSPALQSQDTVVKQHPEYD